MQKDFDTWNTKKKENDQKKTSDHIFFYEIGYLDQEIFSKIRKAIRGLI